MSIPSRAVAWVALFGSAVGSCARPQAPEGGAVPETPLRVVESRPANLSTVEPFDDAVEIQFARTVSQRLLRGSPLDAVVVSPQTGEVEVQVRGDRLEVRMEGGFEAGNLYQISVLPRFQDRYQNEMAATFNLFFSTGPEFEPNLVAGLLSDRLTLDAVAEARVDAVVADRRVVRSVVSDTSGIFSLAYLPSGTYTLLAYEDGNRDGEPGFFEIQDSTGVTISAGDTLIVTDLELLAPDTTAAVLQDVEVLDSLALRVTFDDYLDPEEPLDGVGATVIPEDGDAIDAVEILHLADWEARQPADPDVPDPDDPDAPDPDGADPDGPDPDLDSTLPDGAAQAQDGGPRLPVQDIVLILSAPPVPEVPYEVDLQGVTNINGVPGGGGSAELIRSEPPPPVEIPPADADAPAAGDAPADPAAAPADSAAVQPTPPPPPAPPPGPG